jgi:diguanylate cyclase (GGDEF)-like protein
MRSVGRRTELAGQIAPFAGATALAFALAPIGTQVQWGKYAAALTLAAAILALAFIVPWRALPAAFGLVVPLLFLASAAMLRDAAGGAAAGIGALPLLPVFWVALHGRRAHLVVAIAAAAAYYALPVLLIGGPTYPSSGLRGAAMFSVIAAVIGVTAQRLVRSVRAQARESERRRHELELAAQDRERLVAELERMTLTDPLTGLGNRRAWLTWLAAALASSGGSGDRLAVAVLDLDKFKRFNDGRGHAAGDALLVSAAAAWTAELRPGDRLARIGGEEFAVVLAGCDAAGAVAAIERLRRATPLGQTASAGVAVWNRSETAESLVARADRALYAAKGAGRDRSILADDEQLALAG